MSTFKLASYQMPAAALSKPSPLPNLKNSADVHAQLNIDDSVSEQERQYMGYARVNGILPYTLQDGYNRTKKPRAFKAAVLENEHLRATFLPALGGRLWSLFDKAAGRELLHVNPVFQPCNLALRNAWFSGGVEWNVGIIGHTPFTVSDLAAEKLTLSDGTPVLCMFEYERVRGLFYRVEALLPDGAKQLYVRVRIDNALKTDTAVYWWSNMAVNEKEQVRVIVPADQAFRFGYGGKVAKVSIPYMQLDASKARGGQAGATKRVFNVDITRTTQIPQAMDFFFDVYPHVRPFLAAVDEQGYGMCQTSTMNLRGRKLFVWGMGTGGRNWQHFLADEHSQYMELQSGLAKTQLEHLPMRGLESISWLEAYGPVKADPEKAFSSDWPTAIHAVEDALLCQRGDVAVLDALHERIKREIDPQKGQVVHRGMGFARAEKALRKKEFSSAGLSLAAMRVGKEEKPWMQLAQNGSFPCPDPLQPPTSYMLGDEWENALEKAVAAAQSGNWYAHYQLGVMKAAKGQNAQAMKAFEASFSLCENPWALRCMAVINLMAQRALVGAEQLMKAAGMVSCRPLYLEALSALSQTQQYERMLQFLSALPAAMRRLGRVKTYQILALMRTKRYQEAQKLLDSGIVLADVREGDLLLSDLWFELEARKKFGNADESALAYVREHLPLPKHLDFRMHEGAPSN